MLEKVKRFVDESFAKSDYPNTVDHLQRTLNWLLELKPDADEAMQIAAYGHDIYRAFSTPEFEARPFTDQEYLKEHQVSGAKIISDFLMKENYDQNKISRVFNMVRHHEDGGSEESNIIKDVDSLSYLEKPNLSRELIELFGKEEVRYKVNYMYNRISTNRAKELAEPYYNKAEKILDGYGE